MRSAHYITQLKRTKIPACHTVIDVESRMVRKAGMFHHVWEVGALHGIGLDNNGRYAPGGAHPTPTPADLWGMIDGIAKGTKNAVVWAHNLPYDLRVSDGLRQLTRLGWSLESISLAPQSAWASWERDGAKLMLCDSNAWLHRPLDVLAQDLGTSRRTFDYHKADHDALARRCLEDVGILAELVCRVLNFLVAEDLGNFRPTGSGQSHAAWRRRWMPAKSVLAHADAEALAAERLAMHTGRTEAWRWGEVEGPIFEYDMNLAYCRIAAENPLPQRLAGERMRVSPLEYSTLREQWAVLAEVEVDTDRELVPVTVDERVLWPVGQFTTMLWDPEIDMLVERGQAHHIKRCWLYSKGDALMGMSRWLVERLEQGPAVTDPVAARMLKHWARTVVGRCALRYRQWEYFGEHPHSDLCISHEYDVATGRHAEHLRIGHRMLELAELEESKSSVPSIPGWVMSRCRANLWRLIDHVGAENVLYMDTDGLLLTPAGANIMHDWHGGTDEVVLFAKPPHSSAVIYGPRNVILGDERRLSGVPRKALRLDELRFSGEVWSGLEAALERERTDTVDVSPRHWKVKPTDHRRKHLANGMTEPHRLGDHD